MTFTDIFIRRPVLSLVVSSVILMLGVRALASLPVRQYPLTENTTITITTLFPGAPPELMQGFITQPIAEAVSTIENIDYLSSTSIAGKSVVSVRMKLNADSNTALTQVMARTNQVKHKLPQGIYDPVIATSSGDAAVAYVGFANPKMSIPALTDYLSRVVQPQLASIDGVASAALIGGQQLAMRIWLDPQRMAARGVSAGEIAAALLRNNVQATPGQVKGPFVAANITVNTNLTRIADFQALVVDQEGDQLVRLGDLATIELGAASYDTSAFMDSERAVYFGVLATPKGNPLTIVRRIRELLPAIARDLPPGTRVSLPSESARFIQASIDEVKHGLLEAVVVVVAVIFLSLGSPRAVVIPVVTIPLSILGTAALLSVCGFSINLLTLLAMVLAIGLVVDDAIVVVENVCRHLEEGYTPLRAAVIGTREVAGPVIAMTMTLAAVYAPIGLVGGLTGSLFKEFAFALAGSVLVSGVIALTLSPVMSSFLLDRKQTDSWIAKRAEAFFHKLGHAYGQALDFTLKHRWITSSLAIAMLVSLPLLYGSARRELAPVEDQGGILTAIKAPQHANIDYVERFGEQWDQIMVSIPEARSRWLVHGFDEPTVSVGGIQLTDWTQRDRSASLIQAHLQKAMASVEGSQIFAFQPPPLPGSTGGLPVQMVVRSASDHRIVYEVVELLKEAARNSGLFAVVDSDLQFNRPVVRIEIDRTKAASLGVTMQDIGDTLAVLVGETPTNRFAIAGRSYNVISQTPRADRLSPEILTQYFVETADGSPVPLSNLVQVRTEVEPNKLTQFNQLNSATLQAIPASGVTMGDAVAFLTEQASQLPSGFTFEWQSDARQYTQEGSTLMMTFLFAIVAIYLVLAAQYESLRDPLIILVSVPISVCGALIPLALGFATINIYTQIGLVTLIGLISKHGILMVAFANELQRSQQIDRRDAIRRAALIRLRPILMTTAAMVVGLLPLLLASGAGANSRFSLGLVIVVGMLIGTAFTLLILPTVYCLLAHDNRTDDASSRTRELLGIEGTTR